MMFPGYEICLADNNVWMKREEDLYTYIIIYVDNIISIAKNPEVNLNQIGKHFKFKEPSAKPDVYLGTNVSLVQLKDNSFA